MRRKGDVPCTIRNPKVEVKEMRKKSGFAFIELLVVIAIIAIVVALMFPVFALAREHADFATCQNNLKRLAVATQMYAEDNDGEMPPSPKHYFNAISKYSGNDWLYCPTFCRRIASDRRFGGYGVNGYLDSIKRLAGEPKNTVMLADSRGLIIRNQTDVSSLRHTGNANIAFADGHVKAYSSFDKLDFKPVFKPLPAFGLKQPKPTKRFKRGDIYELPDGSKAVVFQEGR